MSQIKQIKLGVIEFDLCYQGDSFLGIGQISISGQIIRGNSLPLRPYFASHMGVEYTDFHLDKIKQTATEVILHTKATGVANSIAALLDHSLDPIWCDQAWDGRPLTEVRLDWRIQTAEREISGRKWQGLSYDFAFHGAGEEIYYLLDRASWELDGEPTGITLLRQTSGAADPLVTIDASTDYSTSATIGYPLNPVMTYDLPRWSSEQGFDYQYRGSQALIGLFDHCSLIRTIVVHRAGDKEIRHFDKHIFDQSNEVRTTTKFIGIAEVGDEVDHLNAWTSIFDNDQDNVLGEFGMERTYPRTTLSHNFWNNFDSDSYLEDLVPAAAALGFQQIFIDPYWENDMTKTREGVLPSYGGGNMCCPHDYRVADVLGGIAGYQKLSKKAAEGGVALISWIGSHQSQNSPYLLKHNAEVIKMADGRHYYGSGYNGIFGMDLSSTFGPMFRDAAIDACKQTGVSGYLYDSFYNFAWMPINFFTPDPNKPTNQHSGTLRAHTMWRQLAEIMASWQKAGVHMLIESLGPWGQPQHGVMGNYRLAGCALAYQCAVNIGYSTIPTPDSNTGKVVLGEEYYFRMLANKAPSTLNLWFKDANGERQRIDKGANPLLRSVNIAYRQVLPRMHTRTILHDDAGVKWQDKAGNSSVLFSYTAAKFPFAIGSKYHDLTNGESGVINDTMTTEPWHVYEITG